MTSLINKIAAAKATVAQENTELPPHLRNPLVAITRPCLAVSCVKVDLMTASFTEILKNTVLVCREVVDNELYVGEYVQIIPYIGISFDKGKKLLTYRRGNKSQPDLVGEYSIGFGGHVDCTVWQHGESDSEKDTAKKALRILLNEIDRELREELGIELKQIDRDRVYEKLDRGIGDGVQLILPAKTSKPSDNTHLGFSFILDLDDSYKSSLQMEDGHITDLELHDLEDIHLPVVRAEFEHWSKLMIVIHHANVNNLPMFSPVPVEEAYLKEKAIFEGEIPPTTA